MMEAEWRRLTDGKFDDEISLYNLLTDLLVASQKHPISTFFPPEAPQIILGILDSPHEPEVLLIACVLVGCLCNVTSTSKQQLAQRGVVSSLCGILQRATVAFDVSSSSSAGNQLLCMLAEYISTMLVYFSLGPHVCINKLLRADVLSTVVSLVDSGSVGLFRSGADNVAADTLRSITMDRSLVGQRVSMSVPIASVIFDRVVGCDSSSLTAAGSLICAEPCVVSLFDTSGDEDIAVADELARKCGDNLVWRCSNGNDPDIDGDLENMEWVDVRITSVIDETYFWAILGADDIDAFHSTRTKLQEVEKTVFTQRPASGKIVCVESKRFGWYRARIVDALSPDYARVFAIDYGFAETVGWTQLHTVVEMEEDIMSLPPLIHLCSLMGVRPLPANPRIAENVSMTLCNVAADERVIRRLSESGDSSTIRFIIERLAGLVTCSHVELQTVVIRMYGNLARIETLRSIIVECGILDSVLGVMHAGMRRMEDRPYLSLVKCCLGLFRNVLDLDDNRIRFQQLLGIETLMELLSMEIPEDARIATFAAFRIFIGPDRNDLRRRRTASSKSVYSNRPSGDGAPGDDATTTDTDDNSGAGADSDAEVATPPGTQTGDNGAGGDTVVDAINKVVDVGLSDDQSSSDEGPGGIRYYLNDEVEIYNAPLCELRTERFDDITRDTMARLVCAFLNMLCEGKIYYGITPARLVGKSRVTGIPLTHEKRDHLRLAIDKLVAQHITPRVAPETIIVNFYRVRNPDTEHYVEDLHVIEINVKKPSGANPTLYSASVCSQEPRSYIRKESFTHCMTIREMWAWSINVIEKSKLVSIAEYEEHYKRLWAIKTHKLDAIVAAAAAAVAKSE